jgi:hypothetical protein
VLAALRFAIVSVPHEHAWHRLRANGAAAEPDDLILLRGLLERMLD